MFKVETSVYIREGKKYVLEAETTSGLAMNHHTTTSLPVFRGFHSSVPISLATQMVSWMTRKIGSDKGRTSITKINCQNVVDNSNQRSNGVYEPVLAQFFALASVVQS